MNLERVIAVRNAKTLYRDGAGNVIKVFDKEYSKVDVLNEALNQALVENLSLNIPKIYAVEMIEEKYEEDVKNTIIAESIIINTEIPSTPRDSLIFSGSYQFHEAM